MSTGVRAPPVFHGEPGKDDLPAFLHDLCSWYHTTKSICRLNDRRLFEIFSHGAFPFRSTASWWFKATKSHILAEAEDDVQDANALLTHTVRAVSEEFDYLNGDKESKLFSMELQAGENLATFVMQYHDLALEAEVREEKALYRLISAVSTHAPDYAQALENRVIDQTATLEEADKLAQRYNRHYAVRGRMPVPERAKSNHKHVSFKEPDASHQGTLFDAIADLKQEVQDLKDQIAASKPLPRSSSTHSTPYSLPCATSSLLGGGARPSTKQLTAGPSQAAPKPRAPCQGCGRIHSRHSLCYGPNFERSPWQPKPQVNMTSNPLWSPDAFASNADLQVPYSMCTMIHRPEIEKPVCGCTCSILPTKIDSAGRRSTRHTCAPT